MVSVVKHRADGISMTIWSDRMRVCNFVPMKRLSRCETAGFTIDFVRPKQGVNYKDLRGPRYSPI